MKYLKTALCFVLVSLSSLAFSQETAAALKNQNLTYERTDKGFFGWSSPVLEKVRVEKLSTGETKYNQEEDYHLFDSASFSFTGNLATKTTYVLQVVSDKNKEGFSVGDTWKNSFVTPATKGSRCPTVVNFDFVSTVAEHGSAKVVVNKEEKTVSTITVKQEGEWSSPVCGKGRITTVLTYSPEIQSIIFMETAAYAGSVSKVVKKTLKEASFDIVTAEK